MACHMQTSLCSMPEEKSTSIARLTVVAKQSGAVSPASAGLHIGIPPQHDMAGNDPIGIAAEPVRLLKSLCMTWTL